MKAAMASIGLLFALLAASLLLCWPQQPRRLLTLSLSWTASALDADWALAENPEEDFNRWMSNAGLTTTAESPAFFRDRLALRLLAFAVDVLPPSVTKTYAAELAQVRRLDLAAERPLTEAEKLIKEALLHQANSGEELGSSGSYSYWGFLPKFVDRVSANQTQVTWSSRCWNQITAVSSKVSGNWVLKVKVSKAKHLVCDEIFGFFTGSHFRVGFFPAPIGGTKTFTFPIAALTESQVWDVETLGIRVFTFQDNPLVTVRNILETALLFAPDRTRGVQSSFAERNADFMRNYIGATLKPRKDPGGLLLNSSDIRSGDFIGVLRLDGLDPMLAWGMGSHTGHTAIAIWEHGELYVAESTVNSSYWPTNGIQRTPYQKWIEQARAAGYSTVHAPLKEEYRSTFDESGANAFFHKYEGLEYGYHAMLTGWIDTLHNNYPCKPPYDAPQDQKQCLTWEFIEVAVPIVTRYIPKLEKPFLLAWNQHVTGSSFSNLSATELYRQARAKGMELAEIPAVAEPDGILYPSVFNNGTTAPSIAMVCDVFVCSMWKAGGVFKAIDNDFSCIEQTNVDVYDLNVLEAPSVRKEACVSADPENPLCQLTGVYGLELPKLGTRAMYRHMQEKCPTEPPLYSRPDNC